MKVLHVITSLETGGAEKLMADLLPRLKHDKVSVDLCVFNGTETPFLNELRKKGIDIISFGTKGNYYSFRHLLKLIRLARQYDVIHTHNTSPQIFGAIASLLSGKKWVTTEHTTTSNRRIWWFKPIEKWLYNRYDNIICISQAAADAVSDISGLDHRHITVIPNGIDIDKYRHAEPVDRQSVGSTDNKTVVIMVGRFSYQKDQATIIKAMRHLPESFELWLVGDGDTASELHEVSKHCQVESRVRFLGLRTDVPNMLKSADIVVQSSHIEGFGLAAVEGMAAGKPVIASDIPGLRDVVEGAGILFKHEDDKGLAKYISEISDDKNQYADLCDNGINKAASYSLDKMVEKYLTIYHLLRY